MDDSDGVVIQVGTGDNRYSPVDIELEEMPEGEMVPVTVELNRKNQVVNF